VLHSRGSIPRRFIPRKGRARKGRPAGVWYPDLVGVVRSYPPTLEAFLVQQARTREFNRVRRPLYRPDGSMYHCAGVPKGYGRKRALITKIQERAYNEAAKVVELMKEREMLPTPQSPDEERVEAAFGVAMEIMLARDDPQATGKPGKAIYSPDVRMKAVNTILTFLKSKPIVAIDARVTKAEDFLDSIVLGPGEYVDIQDDTPRHLPRSRFDEDDDTETGSR